MNVKVADYGFPVLLQKGRKFELMVRFRAARWASCNNRK